MAIINLTALDDIFDDLDTNNTINGLAGADDIEGRGGDDVLNGGDGDDYLKGDGGDTYAGPFGNDTLNGGAGDDVMRGGGGLDSYDGGTGIDRVSFFSRAATAGVKANLATGVIANDGFGNAETMISVEGLGGGTAFVDTFTGNAGDNFIIGGIGDLIVGGDGDDTFELDGTPGTLDGGLGVDTITSFNDRALVADSADADTLADVINPTLGVKVNLATGTLTDGFGNNGTFTSIENVGGSHLGDTLIGSTGANTLQGFDGDDVLKGGGGNDVLDGGAGQDRLDGGGGGDLMLGGGGSDTYIVNSKTDKVAEFFSTDGTADTVMASVSHTLGLYVENLVLTGTGAIKGTGNAANNTITGNISANTLNGAAGADTLNGGQGHDVLTGGTGADNFVFNASLSATHSDTITDFTVGQDHVYLENSVFTGLSTPGALSSGAFVTGAAAADASDRVIYDAVSGALYYDADGTGAGAQIQIATLQSGLALTSADFVVI